MLVYSILAALNAFKTRLSSIGESEEGQGLVEYAMILVLVAVVAFVALAMMGDTINNVLYRNGVCVIANTLSQNTGGC